MTGGVRHGTGAPVIEVEHFVKRYGDTVAVEDVSFSVEAGEILGIVGPNGAGKTTSVECLLGLRRPDGGRMRVLGLDPQRDTDTLRRHVGCQLQESALPDRMRVWEALDLFGRSGRVASDWRRLAAEWGLAGKYDAPFARLSGGERQRLFIALALVNEPEVVFLDELAQGLDPGARRAAWDLIRAVRERGTTVVLVSHDMDETERLCDRVAVMDRGRIVALASPRELVARYGGDTRMTFSCTAKDVAWLGDVPDVHRVSRDNGFVRVDGASTVVALVAAALVERGFAPPDFRVERDTLEDVFFALTGAGRPELLPQ